MKRGFKGFLLVAVCLALSSAVWGQGQGHGKDKDRDDRVVVNRGHRDIVARHDRDHDRDDRISRERRGIFARHDRDHDRDDIGPGHRPPGWDRGRKTGWRGGDEPPGLAKKHVRRHHRRHHRPVVIAQQEPKPTTPIVIHRRPRPVAAPLQPKPNPTAVRVEDRDHH